VHADGSTLVLELAHAGVDEDGFDHWAVMTEVDFVAGDHIEIAVMPQMSCVEFPLAGWKAVEGEQATRLDFQRERCEHADDRGTELRADDATGGGA
jgi:hypothetical protein